MIGTADQHAQPLLGITDDDDDMPGCIGLHLEYLLHENVEEHKYSHHLRGIVQLESVIVSDPMTLLIRLSPVKTRLSNELSFQSAGP